jgi:hypothetical protein
VLLNNGTNVGIGGASFSEKLDVTGNVRSSTGYLANDGTAATPSYRFTNSPTTGIFRPAADAVGISTVGTERVRVAASGNVGIGITAEPAKRLEVNGDIILSRMAAGGTPGIRELTVQSSNADNDAGDALHIRAGSANVSTETGAGGNLLLEAGSGNSAGAHVAGNVLIRSGSNTFGSGTTNGHIILETGAVNSSGSITERMRIANNGDITLPTLAHPTENRLLTINAATGQLALSGIVPSTVGTVTNVTGTAPISVASNTTTPVISLNDNGVTNAKLADMGASTIKGAVAAGDPQDLTPAQVRTMLNVADGANNYVHPTQSSIDANATDNGINVIDRVQVNTLGHVTSVTARDLSLATTSAPGVMSAADKTKLDGITAGATANTGTVTSVALTMPTGLSVANSPITSSGTLAVTTTLNGPIKGNGSGFTAGAINLASTEVTGTLPIARGGTNGTATPTSGGVAYGNGTAYAFTAAGTAGQVLMSNGSSAPTWGSGGGFCYERWGVWGCATGFSEVVQGRAGGQENYHTDGGVQRSDLVCVSSSATASTSWGASSAQGGTYRNRMMRANSNGTGMQMVQPRCSVCCKGGCYTTFGVSTCATGYSAVYTGRTGGTERYTDRDWRGETLCIDGTAAAQVTWNSGYATRLMRHREISNENNGMDQVPNVCAVCCAN